MSTSRIGAPVVAVFLYLLIVINGFHSNTLHRQIGGCRSSSSSRSWQKLAISTDVESPADVAGKDVPLTIADRFVSSWKEALQGDQQRLQELLSPGAKWDNPLTESIMNSKDLLNAFSTFFLNSSLTVFNVDKSAEGTYDISYHLSFWYPIGWRPRIIIPGTASLRPSPDGSTIESVKETWDVSLFDIATKQFMPRLWEIFHLFVTPTPEYPPIKSLARIGKVEFAEMPRTVSLQCSWEGPTDIYGPPISCVPGFSLFGPLQTSKMGREKFFTSLPVEVHSRRYKDTATGKTIKRSAWNFHVPTALQDVIIEKARSPAAVPLVSELKPAEIDEIMEDGDFKRYPTKLENVDLIKSVTGGILRGNYEGVDELVAETAAKEKREYAYHITKQRLVAKTDILGEPTAVKISDALKRLRGAIEKDGTSVMGRPVRIRHSLGSAVSADSLTEEREVDQSAAFGLLLWNVKTCFSPRAEPGMAVYEIQYGQRRTTVFLELEMD